MYLAIYRRSWIPNGPVDGTIDERSCGKKPEEAWISPAIERRLRGWEDRPADGAADPRPDLSGTVPIIYMPNRHWTADGSVVQEEEPRSS